MIVDIARYTAVEPVALTFIAMVTYTARISRASPLQHQSGSHDLTVPMTSKLYYVASQLIYLTAIGSYRS